MRMAFSGKMVEDLKLIKEMIDFDQKINHWHTEELIKVLSKDAQLQPKIKSLIDTIDNYEDSSPGKNQDGSYFPRLKIPPTGTQKRGYSEDFYNIKVLKSESEAGKSSWKFDNVEYTSKQEAMKAATVAAKEELKYRAMRDMGTDRSDVSNLKESVEKLRTVIFGDSLAISSGTSGRFAALRGYDGINLSNAYDKNFAILLNRGKVKVQKDEVKNK